MNRRLFALLVSIALLALLLLGSAQVASIQAQPTVALTATPTPHVPSPQMPSNAPAGVICGYVWGPATCTEGVYSPVIVSCDGNAIYQWQPSNITLNTYYRISNPTFETAASCYLSGIGDITDKIASWSQHEQITSCDVCAVDTEPPVVHWSAPVGDEQVHRSEERRGGKEG